MQRLDSRRLTGPNLLLPGPGALIDVALESGEDAQLAIATWRAMASQALEALGWASETLVAREFHGGMSVAFSAPNDALYTATELNEWAWDATARALGGEPAPKLEGPELERIAQALAAEQQPVLLRLEQEALGRGLNFCADDEWVTVGMGAGGKTWATPECPEPSEVAWSEVSDRPAAFVTGTNGKTTTVRMLESIVKAAGLRAGSCSTDRIIVDGQVVDEGDWSGTGGARAVVKHEEVDVCLLEAARGGLLRRGLGLPRVDVAAVTNVTADHLGEMGVHDVPELCEVKFVVERAAECLVLNADDAQVLERGERSSKPVTWFSLDCRHPKLAAALAAGFDVLTLRDGALLQQTAKGETQLAELDACPALLGGAAQHNVSNALAAAGVALHLGLSPASIASGLAAFGSDAQSNPGRLNRFEVDGATVLVDFAHNPAGLRAILETAQALRTGRFGMILGQAGDRDDASIVALARTCASFRPDRVVIKDMNEHARGRPEGEAADLIESQLRAEGLAGDQLQRISSELEAAKALLEWARPGDVALLLCHAQRDEVLTELARRA